MKSVHDLMFEKVKPGALSGVAISTTGDEHRLRFLETCVCSWNRLMPQGSPLVVTVDGTDRAVQRVAQALRGVHVERVGQPKHGTHTLRDGRLGVAVNKNTGIEWLMDRGVEHLYLSDDDTWPLSQEGISLHQALLYGHSMVAWGRHRREALFTSSKTPHFASWSWPRGVMLYTQRRIIERVGGMVEAFGPGGHEHVEWSRRIFQAGYTPQPYISPIVYGEVNFDKGLLAMGARDYWHCEDMQQAGESMMSVRTRRQLLTSVRRKDDDWPAIERIMDARDGDTSFVPYTAADNQRGPATLVPCETA